MTIALNFGILCDIVDLVTHDGEYHTVFMGNQAISLLSTNDGLFICY